MTIYVLGGGWITAAGYGQMQDGTRPVIGEGPPQLPPTETLFPNLPPRFRRFDMFTRLGLSAIALAIHDSGLVDAKIPRPVGIVISSMYECYEVDLAYYQTALEEDGLYASPNLFSYTLPGIVSGEAAIHYQLTGPTFTVGDERSSLGLPALTTGMEMIRFDQCRTVICGWLDAPGPLLEAHSTSIAPIRGAIFAALSKVNDQNTDKTLQAKNGAMIASNSGTVRSIADIF